VSEIKLQLLVPRNLTRSHPAPDFCSLKGILIERADVSHAKS